MQHRVLAQTEGLTEDEWLALRRQGLGGSDMAAIAGVSPWKSPISVYLEKIGSPAPKDIGEAAHWGHIHEASIANEFAERNGCKVFELNAIIQHPEYPWMLANVDRIISDAEMGEGVLECKSTGALTPTAACYDDEDGVANEHLVQLQWYLDITGLKWGFIAVLVGGNRYVERFVKRDQEIIDHLHKIGKDFWDLVERREMPAIDASDDSARMLDYLYSKTRPEAIELIGEGTEKMIRGLLETKASIKALENTMQGYENGLKALMGPHEAAFLGESLHLSWKSITANKFQQKEFQEAQAALFKQYSKPSTYRRFLVSEKKKKEKKGKGTG